MTSSLLLSFDCKEFENSKLYMIGDPSILCTDPDYKLSRIALAYPMLGLLVVGIPVAYFWILSQQRQSLNPTQGMLHSAVGEEQHSRNLERVAELKKAGDGDDRYHASRDVDVGEVASQKKLST